jgi:hypothetical protein
MSQPRLSLLFASLLLLSAILLLASIRLTSTMAAEPTDTIAPGTPEAAQAEALLDHTAKIDRLNAQSYQGGADTEAATFYYQKAQEAEALAKELRANHRIFGDDFRDAQDNSRASLYTGGY